MALKQQNISIALGLLIFIGAHSGATGSAGVAPLKVEPRVLEVAQREPNQAALGLPVLRPDSVTMPFVAGGGPGVARKINEAVFLDQLAMPAPLEDGKTFKFIPNDFTRPPTLVEFQASQNRNKRLLTLMFTRQRCERLSKGCEVPYRTTMNFDTRTGRMISVGDLFTEEGLSRAAIRINEERERRYRARIEQLSKERDRRMRAGVELGEIPSLILHNGGCRQSDKTAQDVSVHLLRTTSFVHSKNRGMTVFNRRCSTVWGKPQEDVNENGVTFTAADLAKLLSPYGKTVMFGTRGNFAPYPVFDRLHTGRIGSAEITALFHHPRPDGYFTGIFYYQQRRQVIRVSGWNKQGETPIVVTEDTQSEDTITLAPQGRSLVGKWQGKGKNGKTFNVVLEQ